MSEQNDAAKKAAEEKKKADAEAKKQAEEAKKKADAEAKKRVMVILEQGTLGHLLLKNGDVTDDSEYVALLDDERGRKLVREVK